MAYPEKFHDPFDPRVVIIDKNSDSEKYRRKNFLGNLVRSNTIRATVFFILIFLILDFWLFRYDDFANSCHIKIYPSLTEANNLQIKKAIKLMKRKDSQNYQKLCSSVKKISPELACGGAGGGCYNSRRSDEITVSTSFRPKESHTETTAAIIAHEVCHLFQNKEGRSLEESECYDEYCRALGIMGVREDYDKRCVDR